MNGPGVRIIQTRDGRKWPLRPDIAQRLLDTSEGAIEIKPTRRGFGDFVSALGNKESYSSPERAKQLGIEGLHAGYDLTAQNMPAILATAATLPLGGIGGVAGMGARVGAGALGAYGGSLAGDAMMGQSPDFNAAAKNFGWSLPLGVGGEGLGALSNMQARSSTRQWARPTPAQLEESPQLLQDLIDTRATYRRGGKEPKEPLAAKQKSSNKTNEMLARNRGASIDVDAPLQKVQAMRDKIASYAPTDARLPEIDAFIQAYHAKWDPIAQANGGRIPVEDAHGLKGAAWDEARFTDNNAPNHGMLHRMVGQDTRAAIGAEIPKSRGSVGYNKQDEMTHRYHEASEATKRAGTLNPPPAPIAAHTIGAAIGGGAGYAAHGAAGATGGMIGTEALLRLMENPYFANRFAQFLSHPATQAAIRNAPRFAGPAMQDMAEKKKAKK